MAGKKAMEAVARDMLGTVPKGLSYINREALLSLFASLIKDQAAIPHDLPDEFYFDFKVIKHDNYGNPSEWIVNIESDHGRCSLQFTPNIGWKMASLASPIFTDSPTVKGKRIPVKDETPSEPSA